jgi:elongation factor P
MPGTASDLRVGAVIKLNGELLKIIKYDHVTPGKGPAHHQCKLRNIKTGKLLENRFRSGESIDFVRVENRNYQYLYRDSDTLFFMSMDDYNQIPVQIEIMGEEIDYMKENQEVQLAFVGDEVLSVELPLAVNLRVTHTEPGLKGDTATNVLKPAVVETGAAIQVPLFINENDLIRIDTTTGAYIERVKE